MSNKVVKDLQIINKVIKNHRNAAVFRKGMKKIMDLHGG
jgi:hypothetical protein